MHHYRTACSQVDLLVVAPLAVIGGQLGLGRVPTQADAAGVAAVLAVVGLCAVVERIGFIQVSGDTGVQARITML